MKEIEYISTHLRVRVVLPHARRVEAHDLGLLFFVIVLVAYCDHPRGHGARRHRRLDVVLVTADVKIDSRADANLLDALANDVTGRAAWFLEDCRPARDQRV